jgi:hypothetical protein
MILLSLGDFQSQLDAAAKKLQRLGVRIGGTRIARYQKIIGKALTAESQGNIAHQSDPSFVNALIESSELIDIAALDEHYFAEHHVREKLLRLSSGPEVMAPEGNDPGRNYSFEFSTAARASANGRLHGFAGSGDLAVEPGPRPIECKRISSLRQLEHRLRDARDQLIDHVKLGAQPGVIAVDLTRPIRLEQGVIDGWDDDAMMQTAENHLTAYIARHLIRKKYIDAIAVPAVLGILVRYVACGTAGDAGHIRRSTVWQACSLHPEESTENEQFISTTDFLGPEPVRGITWPEIQAAMAAVDPRA